jgi:butyrate kinase
MATNPQGINPADMAKIQTSNMQTAGGANSGAVGQGSLLSARTKNAGTADAAIAKSGEAASQNLSKANLSTQNANQELKTQQQGEGLKGLQSLYGTNENAAVGGLNASDAALKDASEVPNFWQQLAQAGGQDLLKAGSSWLAKPNPNGQG